MAKSAPPIDLERRRFMNRSVLGALAMFAVAFGGGSIGFIWPELRNGRFGGRIDAGFYKDVLYQLKLNDGVPIYNQTGKFYIVAYDGSDPDGFYSKAGVIAGGLMAIYQKCSHIGCRTPFCKSSQFFECPCHGARFNKAGERHSGPAPAGLWRFPIEINDAGRLIVDTEHPTAQPPMGMDSTGQRPGPFCVDA